MHYFDDLFVWKHKIALLFRGSPNWTKHHLSDKLYFGYKYHSFLLNEERAVGFGLWLGLSIFIVLMHLLAS